MRAGALLCGVAVLWLSARPVAAQGPSTPAQPAAAAADWWRDALYYRLLIDSFKDSDGDGLGDLQGAARNLGYVRSVGAQAVVLSALAARSPDCTRPGVLSTNPDTLDRRYGTDQHLSALLDQADKLELKVVVTLPLETTSVLSEWAVLSANRSAGYEDFLVWQEGDINEPPQPIEGGGGGGGDGGVGESVGWRWHEARGAHVASDAAGAALLNPCSEGLRAAAAAALLAWLRRGAAGVLLQADFPPRPECARALVRHLARAAHDYARARAAPTPVIMVETRMGWRQAAQYYADDVEGVTTGGAHLVLYRDLVAGDEVPHTASDFKLTIDRWTIFVPLNMPALWMSGSPFLSRIATRYSSGMVDAFNMLTLMLPGAALCYQGDELGVTDAILERAPRSDGCSPTAPHPGNAPFPWDDSEHAGFSKGTPWLPLADNHRYCNARSQYASNTSHAAVFRAAAEVRRTTAGAHVEVQRLGGTTLGVLRWGAGGSALLVANVGAGVDEAVPARVPGVPAEWTVVACSAGSALAAGARVASARGVRLAPGEAALLLGGARHCGGPGPVEKIASKLSEAVQKINKYFNF